MKKRVYLISIISFILILFILLFCYFENRNKVAILTYHTLANAKEMQENNNDAKMIVSVEKFEKHLKYLHDHNYRTISLDELYCFYKGTCKLPKKAVVIAFDDGYLSNYHYALPLLKKYKMKATIFVQFSVINNEPKTWSGNISEFMSFKEINEIQKNYKNITIASHSYNLHHPDDYKNLSYEEINQDFQKVKDFSDTKYFAYPYGHVSKNIKQALKENNYKLAFNFGPGKKHKKTSKKDDQYEMSRLCITEDMPMWKFILRLKIPY